MTQRLPFPRRAPLRLALALAVASAWTSATPADAATRTWLGNACQEIDLGCNWSWGSTHSNNWNLPAGSSLTSLPVDGDSLVFGSSFNLRPNNDIAALRSVGGISFVQGAGAYVVSGLALVSTGNISNTSGQLQIINLGLTLGANQTWDGGSGGLLVNGTVGLGDATLSLVNRSILANAALPFTINNSLSVASGSSLFSASAALGTVSGKNSLVTVTGAGSSWVNTGLVSLGTSGSTASSMVQVLDGAHATSGDLKIINFNFGGVTERLTVSGAGSSWTAQNLTLRGDGAQLVVAAGGRFTSVDTYMGDFRPGSPKATVTGVGSTWVSSGLLKIGINSNSTVDVLGGGSLYTVQTEVGGSGATGVVTVAGSGSTWNASGLTGIGTQGVGSNVIVGDGGQANFTGITLGTPSASFVSTLTVSGAGSRVRNTGDFAIDLGTLQVDVGGSVSAGVLKVGASGVVNLNGGTLSFDSFANGGTFNWTSGTLRYDREVNLHNEWLLGATTTLTAGRTLQAVTLTPDGDSILKLAGGNAQFDTLLLTGLATVGTNSTLALVGGTALAVPSELEPVQAALDNQGLVQLSGGTLSATGAIVNRETFTGWGTIAGSGGLVNSGAFVVSGGNLELSNTGYAHNTGSWSMLAGRSLTLSGSVFYNEGTLSLAGGSISGSALLVNRSLATLGGYGVVSAPFVNAGRLAVDSGVLSLTNSAGNSGEMRVNSAAATLSTRMADNGGQIRLAGGTFDNNGLALNNAATGVISGYGRITSGTLTQQGQLLLSGGPTTIDAAIVATAGSLSTVSGASRVTFNGAVDVQAGAEFNVAAGSVASFWAPVQQRTGAVFSGAGLKVYEAGFSVGTSPGLGQDAGSVSFGNGNIYLAEIGGTSACTLDCATDEALRNASYDKTIVGGTLMLGGTLKLVSWNGFVAQAGQHFDLLDWGTLGGSFGSIDASGLALAAGTTLDASQLYTSGELLVVTTAVPEPGIWALWLAGLGVLAGLTRRRAA